MAKKEITLKLTVDIENVKDVSDSKPELISQEELEKLNKRQSAFHELKINPGMTAKVLLQTRSLTKIYGSGRTSHKALDDINLEIRERDFVSIMGPSGSGKTTLLNMLGALDRPTKGSVEINGIDTSKIPESKLYKIRREQVGFIFQNYYLVPTLTALENVLTPTYPLHLARKYRDRAENLLQTVGLGARLHNRPSALSGGEQQRVAIARALILNPPIIFADEPTGNLDTKTGHEVFRLMKELNQNRGVTFVIVTHDPRIAQQTDRTIYLLDGQISTTPILD
jgi:putative ABC transport system ATP-binding protein